jgi:glycosyltransferase involved in cell wall biosynthesis
MPELLSICIPTWNRAVYLGDLLESLAREHEARPWAGEVTVTVADNASTDDTPAVVARFASRIPLVYHRHAVNIGGDWNFARVISLSAGDYFWWIGDDETVAPGSVARLLELLRSRRYGLVLLPSVRAPIGGGGPLIARAYARREAEGKPTQPLLAEDFANYAAFVDRHAVANPFALIAHSLISLNVVRRDCYDPALHRRVLDSQDIYYAHMYGLVGGQRKAGASVHFCNFPVVVVREARAAVPLSRLIIRRAWSRYLSWLSREFGRPELARQAWKLYGPLDRLNYAVRKFFGGFPPWEKPPADEPRRANDH